jgi:dynamin 1-like protein
VSNKQEKERKRLIQEEREKRERRRQKELGPANGADTPEDDEAPGTETIENLPHRKHLHKGARSMSPAVRENGTGGIAATMNGARSGSPPRFNGQATGGTRDSFLNYFFGKDGGLQPGGTGAGQALSSVQNPNLSRHVSQSTEPSISQSIRRQEERVVHRTPAQQAREDDYELGRAQRDYDYTSPFVSFIHPLNLVKSNFELGQQQ